MHSTYVRMAMDRQRAELHRRHGHRSVTVRARIADAIRKLIAFLFTQVIKTKAKQSSNQDISIEMNQWMYVGGRLRVNRWLHGDWCLHVHCARVGIQRASDARGDAAAFASRRLAVEHNAPLERAARRALASRRQPHHLRLSGIGGTQHPPRLRRLRSRLLGVDHSVSAHVLHHCLHHNWYVALFTPPCLYLHQPPSTSLYFPYRCSPRLTRVILFYVTYIGMIISVLN